MHSVPLHGYSPAELRRYSTLLVAHCRELRRDAEAARQKAAEIREIAERLTKSAALHRFRARAAQQRQDGRS
jgi:hypothetical protein